jgi:hypothetical protein
LLILETPLLKLKTFTMDDERTHIMLVSFISLMASYLMWWREMLSCCKLHCIDTIVPGGNDDGKNGFETLLINCTRVKFEALSSIAQGLSLNTFTYLCKFDTKLTH